MYTETYTLLRCFKYKNEEIKKENDIYFLPFPTQHTHIIFYKHIFYYIHTFSRCKIPKYCTVVDCEVSSPFLWFDTDTYMRYNMMYNNNNINTWLLSSTDPYIILRMCVRTRVYCNASTKLKILHAGLLHSQCCCYISIVYTWKKIMINYILNFIIKIFVHFISI